MVGIMFHSPMGVDKASLQHHLDSYLGPRFQFRQGEDPTEAIVLTSSVKEYIEN